MKQARDVVDPRHADFNPRAALAMTEDHAGLACYACHTGWNPDFFGFHFDRNEGFTQLDVLEGSRTEGRVSTLEKVFATFKQLQLGRDSHGAVAPYMVGFSTMATVHAADGTLILDQEMPVTAAGLSGMTMIHHQTHATTPRARTCVECHRAPVALGFGSVNFRLAREFLLSAGERGISVLGFDRKNPANTKVVAEIALPGVRAMDLRCDDLQGRAAHAFAATAEGELWTLDLRSPLFAKAAGKIEGALEDPRDLLVAGDLLFAADGKRGVAVFDASTPSKAKPLGTLALPAPAEARGLHLDGPWLYVAAGPAGLLVVDVADPAAPRLLSRVALHPGTGPDDARSVSVLFQFSRPNPLGHLFARYPARGLAAVANGKHGLALVDVTLPEKPALLRSVFAGKGGVVDAALGTIYELGSEGGGIPSRERDLAFALGPEGVSLLDVSDTMSVLADVPGGMRGIQAGFVPLPGGGARSLAVLRAYNPPFLQTHLAVVAPAGTHLVEVTRPAEPVLRGTVPGVGLAGVAVEEFPLDRMIDARGRPLKDVSHEGARHFTFEEAIRILRAPVR